MSSTNFTNISVSGAVNASTVVTDSIVTNTLNLVTTDWGVSGSIKTNSIVPYTGNVLTVSVPQTIALNANNVVNSANLTLLGDFSITGNVISNVNIDAQMLMLQAPATNQNRITSLINPSGATTVSQICMVSGNTATGIIDSNFGDVIIRSTGGDSTAVSTGTGNCDVLCKVLTVGKAGSTSGSIFNVLSPNVTMNDANVSCKTLTVTGTSTFSGNIVVPATKTLVVGKAGPATATYAVDISGNVLCDAKIQNAGIINNTNTTDSTSISTGAVITTGGLGVAKAVNIGTTLNVAGLSTLSSGNVTSTLNVVGNTTGTTATFSGTVTVPTLSFSSLSLNAQPLMSVFGAITGTTQNILDWVPFGTPAYGTFKSQPTTKVFELYTSSVATCYTLDLQWLSNGNFGSNSYFEIQTSTTSAFTTYTARSRSGWICASNGSTIYNVINFLQCSLTFVLPAGSTETFVRVMSSTNTFNYFAGVSPTFQSRYVFKQLT